MDELDLALPVAAVLSGAAAGWAWASGKQVFAVLGSGAALVFLYWYALHRSCPVCRERWRQVKRRWALRWVE